MEVLSLKKKKKNYYSPDKMPSCRFIFVAATTRWCLTTTYGLMVGSKIEGRRRVERNIFNKNPFDRRPGATIGLLQVAMTNEKALASKFLGDEAKRLDARSARGLSMFVESICTGLSRRDDSWVYAHTSEKWFNGAEAERNDHERYYNRLTNKEAAKFEKEYIPSSQELKEASDDVAGGYCVASLIVALEGDLRSIFQGAANSVTDFRYALADLAAAATVDDGYSLFNAELLWTPSSPQETLLREDMLLDFPELLAL
mmetsp:Transcript_7743/g.11718  ORF Transcript_7743/g.11718 Transcript_7743/m.11718 type:complete len:257 (+) Transcript_7743:12-782(+)